MQDFFNYLVTLAKENDKWHTGTENVLSRAASFKSRSHARNQEIFMVEVEQNSGEGSTMKLTV